MIRRALAATSLTHLCSVWSTNLPEKREGYRFVNTLAPEFSFKF
jgi:hypothetical protein